jgi:hypothetical protein
MSALYRSHAFTPNHSASLIASEIAAAGMPRWRSRMKPSVLTAMLLLTVSSFASALAASRSETEASSILAAEAKASGRPAYSPGHGVNFKPSYHVFVKSALAVDFTYRNASVTLPLFQGRSSSGKDEYFIITDASDFEVARMMGVNYAPKLAKARGTAGVQDVTIEDGIIVFKGDVDFSPTYKVTPGDPPGYFPPKEAQPGAVANDAWSSIVVLPSGLVLNAQIVQNDSGAHDRVKDINLKTHTVTLSILDGVRGGKQYFYHLVTDASAAVPAVLEKGVFAPRLAKIPAFGKSMPKDDSALLGFSPVLNGRTDKGSGEDQGFSTALGNGGIDPINVFPVGPENEDASKSNNYSPLWDAHVSMWTPEAVKEGKVHRIRSMEEQKMLIKEKVLTSADINPPGPGNSYVGGLRPTQAIINCPVIAQPELPPQ